MNTLITRNKIVYTINAKNFCDVPGKPIAYWVSANFTQNYSYPSISNYGEVITGMTIGDNNKYLRLWYEINVDMIAFNRTSMNDIDVRNTKWIPYSKGGPRRNWYGNYEYVVNWSEKDKFNRSKTTLQHLYLKEALTWSFITTGMFSARLLPIGSLWDVAGSPCFIHAKGDEYYVLGLLCSKPVDYTLKIVNPTINVQAIDIAQIPLIKKNDKNDEVVVNKVKENINISIADWDSFETSWDFKKHPLI